MLVGLLGPVMVEAADGTRRKIRVPRDGSLKGSVLPSSQFKILPDGTAYFAFNTCANDEPSRNFAAEDSAAATGDRVTIAAVDAAPRN